MFITRKSNFDKFFSRFLRISFAIHFLRASRFAQGSGGAPTEAYTLVGIIWHSEHEITKKKKSINELMFENDDFPS